MKRDIIKVGEVRGNLKILAISQYRPRKYEVKCLRCDKTFISYPQPITQHPEGCFECREKDLKESVIDKYSKYNGKIFGNLKILGFDGVRNRLRMARCLCLNCGREASIPYTLSKGGSSLLHITSDTIKKNNTSGFTGVSLMKSGKYRAYINFQRKQFHLGSFDTPEDAAAAYRDAKEKIKTDFIDWYKKAYPDLWDKYKDKVERRQEK